MTSPTVPHNIDGTNVVRCIEPTFSQLQIGTSKPDLDGHIKPMLEHPIAEDALHDCSTPYVSEDQRSSGEILDKTEMNFRYSDGLVEAVLELYKSCLAPELSEELAALLLWVNNTMRSLSLSEISDVVNILSPPRHEPDSIAEHIREHYGALLKLVRDDGVTTSPLDEELWALLGKPYQCISSFTKVEFVQPYVAAHFQKQKQSQEPVVPETGPADTHAEVQILNTC